MLAVLAVALGLGGCSSAPEVGDGSLGTDWAVLPTPSVSSPVAGTCTAAEGTHASGWTLAFLPGNTVDCRQPHLAETYHVGSFPADVDTDPNSVPMVGTARFRYAYTACLEQAVEFLGADPHNSRLVALPVMPAERQWAGKARWFRCELVELAGLDRKIASRTESLRDALADDGPLTTTCADVTLDAQSQVVLGGTFVPCEFEHDVELTGAFTLPEGDYPGDGQVNELVKAGCQVVGARYVGISVDDLLRPGSNAIAFNSGLTEEQWSVGERSTACYFGNREKRRTGTIKDLGSAPY